MALFPTTETTGPAPWSLSRRFQTGKQLIELAIHQPTLPACATAVTCSTVFTQSLRCPKTVGCPADTATTVSPLLGGHKGTESTEMRSEGVEQNGSTMPPSLRYMNVGSFIDWTSSFHPFAAQQRSNRFNHSLKSPSQKPCPSGKKRDQETLPSTTLCYQFTKVSTHRETTNTRPRRYRTPCGLQVIHRIRENPLQDKKDCELFKALNRDNCPKDTLEK
uniref:Uncharacterized protein n=1 Tax=Trichuris muris TaxID=70415 RepID=A0A5S6QHC6_TRIMR